jgi:protein TonB
MKFKVFLFLSACATSVVAQTETPPVEIPPLDTSIRVVAKKPVVQNDKVYELFELTKLPSFPGGEAEMYKYISKEVQYPAAARKKRITGSVLLSFDVSTTGKVGNVRIIKDIGGDCGMEARRVVLNMPDWIPGEFEGQVVVSRYSLPFRFRLN